MGLAKIVTERNLPFIGEGIDESGRAGEAMEMGDVVVYNESTEKWDLAVDEDEGLFGIVHHQYVGHDDDEFVEDDPIKVRITGVVVVTNSATATIAAGDLVVPAGSGEVKPWSELTDPTDAAELSKAIGKAMIDAGTGDALVIEKL